MRRSKCSTCGEVPVIARNSDIPAVEIHCRCGAFLWVPSEAATLDDRPIDDIEADAIELWNKAQEPTVPARV